MKLMDRVEYFEKMHTNSMDTGFMVESPDAVSDETARLTGVLAERLLNRNAKHNANKQAIDTIAAASIAEQRVIKKLIK